jgi:predicted permease
MFRNYLKTALRNLGRNKSYAIINVSGLAVGIAACLLIFLVIRYETSFDTFHQKASSIYRITSVYQTQDGPDYSAGTPFPTGPALRLDFPQLGSVANIFRSGNDQVTIPAQGNITLKKFNEPAFFYAEKEFFDMFDFKWLEGTAATSLKNPGDVVLSKEMAEKYFGDWHNALGKTIIRNNKELHTVRGILATIPSNSDFPLGIVASYNSLKNTNIARSLEDWVSTFGDAYTYVTLPENYSADQFNRDLAGFVKKHKPAEAQNDGYFAQALPDQHFNDKFGNFNSRTFNRSIITALWLIGAFLVIIGCVNFINLATAQAVNRSKEVGVRKVLGGNRGQLAVQFLSETALITIAAVMIAICLAFAVLPFLNKLLGISLSSNLLADPMVCLFLVAITIIVSFLSGIYPAIILSGFNPITALKTKFASKMVGGLSLRRVLVVMQFAIAHVLIIGTLIVVSQMNFFRTATLGFDKAAIVNVDIPGDSITKAKLEYMREKLSQQPGIISASFSYSSPSADGNWNSNFKFDNSDKLTNFSANLKWADTAYFRTYKIQFLAGRPFFNSDTTRELVVNETLLKKLGITDPQAALGKRLNFWDGKIDAPIVGVIKDFNAYSLKEPMAPVVLSTWKDVYQTLSLKIKPESQKATMAFVENLWNENFPDYVYEASFLDETISNFYRQEDRLSILYKIFAGIAIFISCLGLYGLVSFMAVQRTKELGIRKVLGASVRNIVFILSKEFTLLIIIAFVIAGPVAWFVMNNWLQNYSYRVKIGVPVFIIAIAGSMLVAWLTVGHRAIKAAMANPVKSLRTE